MCLPLQNTTHAKAAADETRGEQIEWRRGNRADGRNRKGQNGEVMSKQRRLGGAQRTRNTDMPINGAGRGTRRTHTLSQRRRGGPKNASCGGVQGTSAEQLKEQQNRMQQHCTDIGRLTAGKGEICCSKYWNRVARSTGKEEAYCSRQECNVVFTINPAERKVEAHMHVDRA